MTNCNNGLRGAALGALLFLAVGGPAYGEGAQAPDGVEARLTRVDTLLGEKRFTEAADEALRARAIAPGSTAPLLRLARAEAGAQHWPEALAALREALRLEPENEALRLELSAVFFAKKDLAGAEEALRAGLDAVPPSQTLRAALANLLATQGRHQEADQVVGELLNLAPGNRGYLRTAALYSLRRGDGERAEKLLRDALALTAGDRGARVDALSDLANFYAVTGRLPAAEETLEESRKVDPDNPSTLSRLANVLLLRDDLAKAEPVIRALSAAAPKSAATRVLQARLDMAGGRLAEARKALEDALSSAPDAAGARFFLARTYGMERLWDKALEHYLVVVAENPDHFFANLDLAKVYLNLRRPEEALVPLGRVLALRPDFEDALRLKADALLNAGKAQEAEAVLRQLAATARGGDRSALDLKLGQALEAQNRLAEAFESYERSAAGAPSAVEPVQRQMAVLDRLGKRADADKLAESFLAAGGTSPLLLFQLAVRAFEDNQLPAARGYLARALEGGVNTPPAKELEARLRWKDGDLAGARRSLDEALALSPDRISSLALSADLFDVLHDTPAACRVNERILQLDPTNARAANNLAVALADDPQKLDEALRLARTALAQAPSNPLVLDTLGWVLFRRGEFQQAAERLEDARTRMPKHPEITYHLGAAYWRMGFRDRARPLLDEALAGGGDAPWAADAKRLAGEPATP